MSSDYILRFSKQFSHSYTEEISAADLDQRSVPKPLQPPPFARTHARLISVNVVMIY